MARTIFLQIGQKDRVPLNAFIVSLKNFLGILRDLDSAISKDEKGSVIWEVVSLQQNSPPIVGVSPSLRTSRIEDHSWDVEVQILENTSRLTRGEEPTPLMSFAALQKLENLAKQSRSLGPHKIYVNGSGEPMQESVITDKTFTNVQQLTKVKYSGFGSISGNLEAIYVHNANEIRVWDDVYGKPVRCKFSLSQEEHVKALLRARVTVSGIIKSNQAGIPISMELEEIEKHAGRKLPTIAEMSGSIPGITEGKPLKKYLEEIGDE